MLHEGRGILELDHVTDGALQSELVRLLASSSRTEARILAHLAAVEDRRLHLEAGSPSLFDYCCKRLGLSENEAFHRITAARLARRFPTIFGLVEARAIHLTAVCLLRDYLTPENHRELLAAASSKTKLQVQELLAQRFPRPDVPSTIRKLPAPRDTAESRNKVPSRDTAAVPRHATVQRNAAASQALAVMQQTSSASELDATCAMRRTGSTTGAATNTEMRVTPRAPASRPSLSGRNVVVEPLSTARYRIQLNASAQLKAKLEQARDLLSHANPSGDLAAVIERALDLLLERTLKQRFAQTKRARLGNSASCDDPKTSTRITETREIAPGAARQRRARRSHIANATKREIVARDGLRCTFVGSDGLRCGATRFTQIHHEQPWARDGDETPGNLRILCAAHNHLLAERDFGRELVANRTHHRRIAPRGQSTDPPQTERRISRSWGEAALRAVRRRRLPNP